MLRSIKEQPRSLSSIPTDCSRPRDVQGQRSSFADCWLRSNSIAGCRILNAVLLLQAWNDHPESIAKVGGHMTATIDGKPQAIQPGERLIDLINRCEIELPQVCYHPQLGPIQTCDTCMVEVDGKLV